MRNYLIYAKIIRVLYVCMYVYTLFVSHVNDGFETGIKSDIEFE